MNTLELISKFSCGSDELRNVMNQVPAKALDYQSRRKDAWTIRQHLIHLVDSEANNFIRIRSCVAQPYSRVFVIQEDSWTKNLENRKEDVASFVELFASLRTVISAFLSTLPESYFEERYFIREYKNETAKITLGEIVEMYADHVAFHLDYIRQNLSEYRTAGAES